MSNILEQIVNDRRGDIEVLKQSLPLDTFKYQLKPSERSLQDALSEKNTSFILECKKASPSKGLIREPFDLDEITQAYAPYASAISVLTEHRYFQGDFDYVKQVSEQVHQPVLNKDFLFDPYQVYLARYYHADAILLMLSVLTDEQYRELADIADELALDILTEVSNVEEVQRAIALEAKIIGINNRNLRDLSTDLATTEALRPLIPDDRIVISESGIYSHADVKRLSPIADGFLVGSSLMSETDVATATATLIYGSVKICGITNAADAVTAKRQGARYLGLIFAPQSKRKLSLVNAVSIVEDCAFNYVGVFANQTIEDVVQHATQLTLCAVQLHGEETAEYRQQLRNLLPESCQIWQALGVTDQLPDLNIEHADQTLLDCKVGSQSGGTGKVFDWSLLKQIKTPIKIGLAGGLSPTNISQASELSMAFLDVNSGVENAPGDKSSEKIEQLFSALRCY